MREATRYLHEQAVKEAAAELERQAQKRGTYLVAELFTLQMQKQGVNVRHLGASVFSYVDILTVCVSLFLTILGRVFNHLTTDVTRGVAACEMASRVLKLHLRAILRSLPPHEDVQRRAAAEVLARALDISDQSADFWNIVVQAGINRKFGLDIPGDVLRRIIAPFQLYRSISAATGIYLTVCC